MARKQDFVLLNDAKRGNMKQMQMPGIVTADYETFWGI